MKKLLLIIGLCANVAVADGQEYGSAEARIIHKTYLSMLSDTVTLSTKVGKLVNNTCLYEKETPAISYRHYAPYEPIELNATKLKELVGAGYTCGATHLVSGWGKEGLDSFNFVLDANGEYLDTSPREAKVDLR